MILDEPTVGLDPIQIRAIRELIRELGKEHSVILSTHILPEVQAVCSHVQIIHQGSLRLHTSIDQLDHHLQGYSLQVGFRRPPSEQRLASLRGVNAVEMTEDGDFLIHLGDEWDPTDELVALSTEENLGLYRLMPRQASLEEIFVGLTEQEPVLADGDREEQPS